MQKNIYLNEQKYQENKKKIISISLVVMFIGILIGGGLILTGLIIQSKIDKQYSKENKLNLEEQLSTEKNNLESKKIDLENKGIKYNVFAKYTDGEKYDLYIITRALDPSFNHCAFDEYKNNSLTSKYCSLKKQLDDINNNFNKEFDSFNSIPLYMFGSFIIIASCMIAGAIYMFAKKREITAFTAQQIMPVSKEIIEELKNKE